MKGLPICADKKGVSRFSWTLLLVFSLGNPANGATVAFKAPVSYPVGTNPSGVSVGDFNGDGKLDLAVINGGFSDTGDDGGVSILPGNGDGTFHAARNFSAGKQPESIAIADFNSDGRLDIIAVSESANVLNVLLGNGDGTFQPPVTVTLDDIDPYYVIAGDFNNDHKWDIALSGLGRDLNGDGFRDSVGGTTVMLGNGDGTFQKHGPLLSLSLSEAVDFNQDGRLDLVVNQFPGFNIFLGTGDGSFQDPTSNTAVGGAEYAGDFNLDGELDLVALLPLHVCGVGKVCDGQITVLLGNGAGSFSPGFSQTGPYRTLDRWRLRLRWESRSGGRLVERPKPRSPRRWQGEFRGRRDICEQHSYLSSSNSRRLHRRRLGGPGVYCRQQYDSCAT